MTSQKSSLEPPGDTVDPAATELPEPPRHSRRTILTAVGALAILGLGTTVLGEGLLNPPSSTEDGDFSGETLEFLIPLASGGGTDTWARFIGTELTNYVAGRPGFAPVNEPGGEGISGTNKFARSAKTDGTEILVGTASTRVDGVPRGTAVESSDGEQQPKPASTASRTSSTGTSPSSSAASAPPAWTSPPWWHSISSRPTSPPPLALKAAALSTWRCSAVRSTWTTRRRRPTGPRSKALPRRAKPPC